MHFPSKRLGTPRSISKASPLKNAFLAVLAELHSASGTLRTGNVLYQLPRPAKLCLDDLNPRCDGELFVFLTIRSAKVRARTINLALTAKTYVMVGRAASMRSVFVKVFGTCLSLGMLKPT